jgi:hypothetical protein
LAAKGILNTSGSKKKVSKKVPHDQALTAKVIAKNGGSSQTELANQRRKARREEEKLMAAEMKRKEQRERERPENQFTKPFQQAQDRLQALTEQAISEEPSDTPKRQQPVMGTDQLAAVCEWKEMQLNEIMALEAILHDSDQFFVTEKRRIWRNFVRLWRNTKTTRTTKCLCKQSSCILLLRWC